MEGKKQTALGIVLVFVLYVIFLRTIPLIHEYIADIFFKNDAISSALLRFVLIISSLSLLWFLIIPLMGYPLGRGSIKEYMVSIRFKKMENSAWKNISLGFLCFFVVSLFSLSISLVLGVYKFDPNTIIPPKSWSVLMAISPGVFEEIAFRGVILTMLLKKFERENDSQGVKKAWIISSVLFGLAHIINIFGGNVLVSLAQVFYACFMGLVLGALVLKSDSLIPAMLFHYLIDAFALLITNTIQMDPMIYILWGILMAIIGMGPVPAFICLKIIGWKPKQEKIS